MPPREAQHRSRSEEQGCPLVVRVPQESGGDTKLVIISTYLLYMLQLFLENASKFISH